MDLPDITGVNEYDPATNPIARVLERWCEQAEHFLAYRAVPILLAIGFLRTLWVVTHPDTAQ